MPRLALGLLPGLLPLAAWWVAFHERRILHQGVPLSPEGLRDAALMGVTYPEKVRLMEVERIPWLNGWVVILLSRILPAVSCHTVGLSLRYGIYIRSKYWGNRHLVAHECVHTGQYERHAHIAGFLRAYFTECIEFGYPEAPMEQEAIIRSAELFDAGD